MQKTKPAPKISTLPAAITDKPPANDSRMLRMPDIEHATGLKHSKLYQLMAEGEFPRPVKVGKANLWPSVIVDRWITEKTTECELLNGTL